MSYGYVLLAEDSIDALLVLIAMWTELGFRPTSHISLHEKSGKLIVGMKCDPWPDETE